MACWYCKHDIGRFHDGDGCKYTPCDCKLDKADALAPPAAAPPTPAAAAAPPTPAAAAAPPTPAAAAAPPTPAAAAAPPTPAAAAAPPTPAAAAAPPTPAAAAAPPTPAAAAAPPTPAAAAAPPTPAAAAAPPTPAAAAAPPTPAAAAAPPTPAAAAAPPTPAAAAAPPTPAAAAPPTPAAAAAPPTPAAAPPAAKLDEKSYQDMAIQSVADQEKRREGEKSKTPKESSVKVSNPNIKEQVLQKDKTGNDNEDETTITEVFDSSKYDSMVEMEKSAAIKEREHPEEVLTSVEKEKPIDPTTTKVTKISEVNVDSPPHKVTTFPNVSPPNLEERAANLRDSKEEQIGVGSKEPSQEEIIEVKEKRTDAKSPLSQGLDESYTNFWRETTKSWIDLYVESARNVAEATEYWLALFFKPWLPGGRTKDKSI
jgi:hypothetical protein